MTTWREARANEQKETNDRRKQPDEYACPGCDDRFSIQRVGSFPDPWQLAVAHDHSGVYPVWRAVLYEHRKGQRYPKSSSELLAMVKEQKREAKAKRMAGRSTETKE